MKKWVKRLLAAVLVLFFLLWTAVTVGSVQLTTRPRTRMIEDISTLAERPVEAVTIITEDDVPKERFFAVE
jgi:hypothetical protein